MDCSKVRVVDARLSLCKHDFSVKKTGLSLPAERLSCLYFQLVVYMDAICKKWLLKKYVFLVYRGTIKGSETVFTLGFCPKKIDSHGKQHTRFLKWR